MTLGSVLLRPGRIERAADRVSDDALVEDVIALIGRIVADKVADGTILDDLLATFEGLGDRLLETAGGGLTRAVQHLEDVVAPLASLPDELAGLVPEDGDPLATATAAIDLLAKLGDLVAGLDIDKLRDQVGTVVDVIQVDLGLTAEALEGHLWWMVDDLVGRLLAIPNGQTADMASNRRAVASTLRRFQRRMRDELKFPDLKAHELADALFDVIKGTGAPQTLGKVTCAAKAASEGALVAKDLLRLVPPTEPHAPRARPRAGEEDPQYLWYASWLLNDLDSLWHDALWPRGWFTPPGPVWIDNTGGTAAIKYRNQNLFPGGGTVGTFDWNNIADPSGRNDTKRTYTFRKIPAESMDDWARHLAYITDYVEASLHIFNTSGFVIAKGDMLSFTDFFDVLLSASHGTLKVVKKQPWRFWLFKGDEQWYAKPLVFGPEILIHTLGPLQGLVSNSSGAFYFLCVVSDFLNAFAANSLAGTISGRDFILSMLTMRNYDGPAMPPDGDDNRPDNRNHVDGIVGLISSLIGGIMFIKVVIQPGDYGHPFTGSSTLNPNFGVKMWLGYGLGLSTLFGVIGGFLGLAVAQSLAGILGAPQIDWKLLGKTVGVAGIKNFLTFWLQMYGFRENDSSGGTYNPVGNAFDGYPDNGDSPYLLPYETGQDIMCFQGNMGWFSHNATNPAGPQVYAYDFMLGKGTEVLAARAGTVVDYFDWCADGTNTSTAAGAGADPGQTLNSNVNFIVIRHDAPLAAHDKGPGGTVSRTYSVYLHGQQNGVRNVFPGVAPAAIVGQNVAQGRPIMQADSTGISFCDHVHMQVQTGPDNADRVVQTSALGPDIPFVFKDVNPVIGTNGVPASRSWHNSDNTKVP